MEEENSKTEYHATAKFVEVISNWFRIINARHPKVAIGKIKGDVPMEPMRVRKKHLLSRLSS